MSKKFKRKNAKISTRSRVLKHTTKIQHITKPDIAKHLLKTGTPSKQCTLSSFSIRNIKPHDRILLVGEGDFSFAKCLVMHYNCTNVLATTCEVDEYAVMGKYPDTARDCIALLGQCGSQVQVLYGVDATCLGAVHVASRATLAKLTSRRSRHKNGSIPGRNTSELTVDNTSHPNIELSGNTKTTAAAHKIIRQRAPFDRVIFNFPHVGGRSSDVIRQNRSNQELLWKFFKRLMAFNSCSGANCTSKSSTNLLKREGGLVHVTLWNSSVYTRDWKICQMARSAGLELAQCEPFNFEDFPNYKHVRTGGLAAKNLTDKPSVKIPFTEYHAHASDTCSVRPACTYTFYTEGFTCHSGVKRKRRMDGPDSRESYSDIESSTDSSNDS